MKPFRWLLLPAALALGLAAGTVIGFTADRAATITLTSVRTQNRTHFVTETVLQSGHPDERERPVPAPAPGSDRREHKIQLSEAARFAKTYCTAYRDEIAAGAVSDSGVLLKAQAIGERFGATSAAAAAITEACDRALPHPSDSG